MNELQSALIRLVPDLVGVSADVVVDEAEAFVYDVEGEHLADAVVARRNEFICGRRCARAALAQIGYASCALPPDADGVPTWPDGAVGSISHSRGLCGAIAAPANELSGLGLDLEKTTRLSVRAMARVVHPLEAELVGDDQALGSLLFSAKEAFFKTQFPIWTAQPNFKDLALSVDIAAGKMTVLEIAPNLPSALRSAAFKMQFRYQFFGEYVVTLCWLAHE